MVANPRDLMYRRIEKYIVDDENTGTGVLDMLAEVLFEQSYEAQARGVQEDWVSELEKAANEIADLSYRLRGVI